mmetsp:Transcript_11511/g.26559  ORF Transcript_11511/g.26559 Transcript_11511/m.26559 type:complete len:321 (-) Transcript_11511:151-1113(-)
MRSSGPDSSSGADLLKMAVDVAERLHAVASTKAVETAQQAQKLRKPFKPFLLTVEQEEEMVTERNGAQSWQARVMRFFHSHPVQIVLMVLLVADVAIVMAEIIIDLEFPSCRLVQRDAVSCCADASPASPASHRRLGEAHALCEPPAAQGNAPAGCDEHKWAAVHVAHDVLYSVSVAILSIFLAEMLVLMAAVTPCLFFRNLFYALDFVIVASALGLEIALKGNPHLADEVALIIVLRMWRLVRIGHGLFETTEKYGEAHAKHVEREVEELKQILYQMTHDATALGEHQVPAVDLDQPSVTSPVQTQTQNIESDATRDSS